MLLCHHYLYTHSSTSVCSSREEEAIALLNSLSEGIASKDNHALREVCAASMAEFSRYAIKQATSKTISQSPIAADTLINRLKNMATHPDHSKRSGAVLAFAHIVSAALYFSLYAYTCILHLFYNEYHFISNYVPHSLSLHPRFIQTSTKNSEKSAPWYHVTRSPYVIRSLFHSGAVKRTMLLLRVRDMRPMR
jgi:hypothetical protein